MQRVTAKISVSLRELLEINPAIPGRRYTANVAILDED